MCPTYWHCLDIHEYTELALHFDSPTTFLSIIKTISTRKCSREQAEAVKKNSQQKVPNYTFMYLFKMYDFIILSSVCVPNVSLQRLQEATVCGTDSLILLELS